MGCSKPQWVPCPQGDSTAPNCTGCQYHTIETNGSAWYPSYQYLSSVAKHIHEFTTDELLAELKRRCGT